MKKTFLKIRWPEIDKEILVAPEERNQMLFDWFISNCPLHTLQGHALVSGKHLRCRIPMNVPYPVEHPEWYTISRAKAPVGTVGVFVAVGMIGSILVKYGELTETANYPGIIGNVIPEDLETMKEAGEAIWNATNFTKQGITVEYSAVEREVE